MNTGQTVYEQLQEIQDKIGDRTLNTGCIVFNKEWGQCEKHKVLSYTMKNNGEFDVVCDGYELYDLLEGNIIGHPISLSRVLSALGNEYRYKKGMLYQQLEDEDGIYDQNIAIRKLLTEDGSDAMLDSQSDETISSIYNIIVKNE